MRINKELITNLEWEYGQKKNEQTLCKIGFSKEGYVTGYKHVNEHRWEVRDGILSLIHIDGRTTVRFIDSAVLHDKIILSGQYLLTPELNLTLYLKQAEKKVEKPISYPENCVGYHFIDGGLTNQKLAIFGLFCSAALTGKTAVLPKIYVLNQVSSAMELRSFGEVFDENKICDFAKRFGLSISFEDPINLSEDGWKYFGLGSGYRINAILSRNDIINNEFVKSFFVNFRSLSTSSLILRSLIEQIFPKLEVDVVLQLRIEHDWQKYSAEILVPKYSETEDLTVSALEIFIKIKKTLPNAKNIFVLCDEPSLPVNKNALKHQIFSECGLTLIFKSDILTSFEIHRLNQLDMSLLDFDIACAAKIFIGHSRSTFSCMVPFWNFCQAANNTKSNFYIYNTKSRLIEMRSDFGIYDSPHMAIEGIVT